MERLELSRCCHRGILNPLRLPFRHIGTFGCPNRQVEEGQSLKQGNSGEFGLSFKILRNLLSRIPNLLLQLGTA